MTYLIKQVFGKPRTDQLLICCMLQARTGYAVSALMHTT